MRFRTERQKSKRRPRLPRRPVSRTPLPQYPRRGDPRKERENTGGRSAEAVEAREKGSDAPDRHIEDPRKKRESTSGRSAEAVQARARGSLSDAPGSGTGRTRGERGSTPQRTRGWNGKASDAPARAQEGLAEGARKHRRKSAEAVEARERGSDAPDRAQRPAIESQKHRRSISGNAPG